MDVHSVVVLGGCWSNWSVRTRGLGNEDKIGRQGRQPSLLISSLAEDTLPDNVITLVSCYGTEAGMFRSFSGLA